MNLFDMSTATRTVLLLCAAFPTNGERTMAPLSTREFHRLRVALRETDVDITSLVANGDAEEALSRLSAAGWNKERLAALLARTSELDEALERWMQAELWVISHEDDAYPERLRDRLRDAAPPLLFGAGKTELVTRGGLAIVGSRHADEAALDFAMRLGILCAEQDVMVISGGARGVDQTAMLGCLEANGGALGVLGDSLAREAFSEKYRVHIDRGHLALVTPFSPEAHFSVGNAMGRNKLIYALSDATMVVSADAETGGTWSGAVENLKQKWTPLLVRCEEFAPDGNRRLIRKGAIAFDPKRLDPALDLRVWFTPGSDPSDLSLFPE